MQCGKTKLNKYTDLYEACQLEMNHTSPHLSKWLAWNGNKVIETYTKEVK